eukprot:COSAG01_NODE_5754_length_4054_cov_28.824526_8_plen_70_part_00
MMSGTNFSCLNCNSTSRCDTLARVSHREARFMQGVVDRVVLQQRRRWRQRHVGEEELEEESAARQRPRR